MKLQPTINCSNLHGILNKAIANHKIIVEDRKKVRNWTIYKIFCWGLKYLPARPRFQPSPLSLCTTDHPRTWQHRDRSSWVGKLQPEEGCWWTLLSDSPSASPGRDHQTRCSRRTWHHQWSPSPAPPHSWPSCPRSALPSPPPHCWSTKDYKLVIKLIWSLNI